MAAPWAVGTLSIANTKINFLKCCLPNLRFLKNANDATAKFTIYRAFHSQTHGKHWTFKRHISLVRGSIAITIAGLSFYKLFNSFSSYLTRPEVFQKVHASSSDILNANRNNNNFIADAVDEASPAVVFLRVRSYSRLGYAESQGSGFIVRSDGIILTNAHVVRGNGKITVKMKNGREYSGTVHAIDQVSDLATIKIDAQNLPTIKLGDSSSLRAGEWVVALGCPLSLNFTVTVGIVSSKCRAGEELGFRNRDNIGYIQTDAAITIGNSGGPLINLAGEAIGINTWTVKDGISFAIPSDYAKKFVEKAEAYNAKKTQKSSWFSKPSPQQKRYYLGLTMLTLTSDLIMALQDQYPGFPPDCDHGVIVQSLKVDSPSFRAGLQAGDVIQEINGVDVRSASDVYKAVDKGEELTVTVKRHTKTFKIRVVPLEVS